MISTASRIAIRLAAIPLILGSIHASANPERYDRVFTIGGGVADTEGHDLRYVRTRHQRETSEVQDSYQTSLSYESGQFLTLGAGVQDGSARVMLELYRTDMDISRVGPAPDEDDAESEPDLSSNQERQTYLLYYSGYWRPEIIWGIHAVAGAGIGWGQQRLSWGEDEDRERVSARGWSGKLTLGLEYQINPRLAIYASAETIRFTNLTRSSYNTLEQPGGSDAAEIVINERYSIGSTSQDQYGLGIRYFY